MSRYSLPALIALLGVVVATLHVYALNNFLYWHIPWLDILMHFLGGLLVALFGLWLASRYIDSNKEDSKSIFLFQILLFVFVVSLLWESSELLLKYVVIGDPSEYAIDTIIDFLMSTIGAFVGFYFLHILRKNKTINSHE